MTIRELGSTVLILLNCTWLVNGCENGCDDATTAMEKSIKEVCNEAAFDGNPFCACCVPNGFFSIDDTCNCQPLVLDADFCFYDGEASGHPSVRKALVHAAEVCKDRTVTFSEPPENERPTCEWSQGEAGATSSP